MACEALKDEIFNDLQEELTAVEDAIFNEKLLKSKVDAAVREVKGARKYPDYYTETAVNQDMEQFYSNIRSIALFDYNQTGAEGLKSYSADGGTLNYLDRSTLFRGIIPIGSRS